MLRWAEIVEERGAPMSLASEIPHVLIVTPDSDLAEFLNDGLTLEGFWTSVVSSGLQVLEVFRLRSFDLALIDSELADLDALELIRRLRGTSERAARSGIRTTIPLLLVEGQAGDIDPDKATAAGATGVLSPPMELDDLALVLRTAIQTSK